jgi:hypothetical protein
MYGTGTQNSYPLHWLIATNFPNFKSNRQFWTYFLTEHGQGEGCAFNTIQKTVSHDYNITGYGTIDCVGGDNSVGGPIVNQSSEHIGLY